MSDYTKVYDGASYNSTQAVLDGAVFDTEFTNIATAVNSKLDQLQGTDDLSFDTTAATRQIRGYESGSYKVSMQFKADGDWVLYNDVAGAAVMTWDRSADSLTISEKVVISSASGDMEFDCSATECDILFNTGSKNTYIYGQTSGDVGIYDGTNARSVFNYDESLNAFVVGPALTAQNCTLNGTIGGSAVKDEDNMASNSATAVATQQSTKAYVDNSVADFKKVSYGLASPGGGGGLFTSNESWTVTKLGTGYMRVTHNIGNDNYVVTATTRSVSYAVRVDDDVNHFDLRTSADAAIYFMLIRNS